MKNAKEKECSFSSPREQREREILDGFTGDIKDTENLAKL